MDKLFKNNIYTDIIWLSIGVIGGLYFLSKNSYWTCAVFFFLAALYIIKIGKERIQKKIPDSE
ncbi:hypothetical protein MWU65_17290 [Cellulophaga sp. F20128]|uniref:hypothetical protein n=1 Tax=Cellulophaga sp. F20128 TaxID=2926413 RepID=UPI001FF68319|nr:hypothetical protein [Cellulophaga sp. F20128]MCK0158945.1 hypothetical protein [Cellulophaga sp. F20128]